MAPNPLFIPDFYFSSYLSRGYECYALKAPDALSLKTKIETAASLFPQSLFIFDTSSELAGISWQSFVQDFQQRCGKQVLLSLVYVKSWEESEKKQLKSFYTDVVGIQGGLIGLEAGSEKNQERLIRILVKNSAGGRRKTVRVACDESSTASFSINGRSYRVPLVDVSTSHFSCDIAHEGQMLPVYSKLQNTKLLINGRSFSLDAVLVLRRTVAEQSRLVCMFVDEDGLPGLNEGLEQEFSAWVYTMLSASMGAALAHR